MAHGAGGGWGSDEHVLQQVGPAPTAVGGAASVRVFPRQPAVPAVAVCSCHKPGELYCERGIVGFAQLTNALLACAGGWSDSVWATPIHVLFLDLWIIPIPVSGPPSGCGSFI